MNMPLVIGASVHLTGLPAVIEILVSIAIYFLPTIIVLARKRRSPVLVILLNVFLGWTLIHWLVALILSFGTSRTATVA